MLRSISTNISVITNWGCRANCWYCIWKNHELKDIQLETDWVKLENFLTNNKEKAKVSVSGGGDCLYKHEEHSDWWNRFFEITNNLNMVVDVHSREKFYNKQFWQKINKCVFSSDILQNDIDYLLWLKDLTKIRITHVVTANTTFDIINDYLDLQERIGCQFTIKELVNYNDNDMYKKIRAEYPRVFNLDSGDYNIYYMPDNSVREKFL